MTNPLENEWKLMQSFAMLNYAQFETSPGFYLRRWIEFETYYQLFPAPQLGHVLELGCGTGFQSALLSTVSGKVIATDLERENILTHTPGLDVARGLLNDLGIGNVIVQACSAESLPFPDASFDFIYSSHVLEHVPDRQKAVREMERVLKKGGIIFCAVPTRSDRTYAIFHFYAYLVKRLFYHGFKRIEGLLGQKKRKVDDDGKKKLPSKPLASVRVYLKYFPFPPPHGEFPRFTAEWKLWTNKRWKKILLSGGNSEMILQQTTQFNPLLNLVGAFSTKAGIICHGWTHRIERKLGKYFPFKYIGVNCVMILRKK